MNLSAPPPLSAKIMDVDAFLAFAQTRPDEERWELIDGVPMMMAPPSPAHQRIAQNFAMLLNGAFAANDRDLFAYHGTGTRTSGVRDFFVLPDVVAVPGVSGYDLYAENHQLAAEVVSPSNTRREMAAKLRRYREASDNLYAVFVDAREILVEVHARRNEWRPEIFTQPEDRLELPEFSVTCRVADLYHGTPLDPRRA